MRILITGNMGYIGPALVAELRSRNPRPEIVGLDSGLFAHCLLGEAPMPERLLDRQLFADVRTAEASLLQGTDAVVYLAAISNEPMGRVYEQATMEINCEAALRCARLARDAGGSAFVYASSCSVYGVVPEGLATEATALRPLTAYARSKCQAEEGLARLATPQFRVTCLRFGTACGMSPRLRLDLVLNEFVASALAAGRIDILSDGRPWRPLIHVADIARALAWAVDRPAEKGGAFLVVNAGADSSNYQVAELAREVVAVLHGTQVQPNPAAGPDARSYRVSFGQFSDLAPEHVPRVTLAQAISELAAGLKTAGFDEGDRSRLLRLNTLAALRERALVDATLRWTDTAGSR